MLSILFPFQLHEESDVPARACWSLQFDSKLRQSECFWDAKGDNILFFFSSLGQYALYDGKELLSEPFLGSVDELGNPKVLLIGLDKTENNPHSGYVSPRTFRALSPLLNWREVWRNCKNTDKLLATLCRGRILSLRLSTWLNFRDRIPQTIGVKRRSATTSSIYECDQSRK